MFARSKPAIASLKLQRHFLWMGALGAEVPKPTALWGITDVFALRTQKPTRKFKSVVKKGTLKTIIVRGKAKQVCRISGAGKQLKLT